MNPLDLVSASPWKRVAFTTYALSLTFFEAVILDALVRGGGRDALILTDPEGIRSGLSELGARRAGRDYEVEPVACTKGVFHAKVSAFISADDAHLLVGSGNLTFGGWGRNLEVVEHLHPSFAADAFFDAADFFDLLGSHENVQMDASDACGELAEMLRVPAVGQTRTGNIRIVHSVGDTIADGLIAYADALGGAERIVAISPFYDTHGGGLDALATALGCDDILLHVHRGGTVRGTGTLNWPTSPKRHFEPVAVNGVFEDDKRLLHAKAYEIICRRGRMLVSGSANATTAGLFGRNIEASVVRLQRESLVGWNVSPATAPELFADEVETDDDADESKVGVLRASLEGDQITARLLASTITGHVAVSVKTVRDTVALGSAIVSTDGRFEIAAPGLEIQSWTGGRLVLRVEQDDLAAEGFISLAAVSELIRRAGQLGPKIMAMLAGTETPEDVTAILSWFYENPGQIPTHDAGAAGGNSSETKEKAPAFVPVTSLQNPGSPGVAGSNHNGKNRPLGWERAFDILRAAFLKPRAAWNIEDDLDDDDGKNGDDPERRRRVRQRQKQELRLLQCFEELLETLLDPTRRGSDTGLALAITHYIAGTLRPSKIKVGKWLGKISAQVSTLTPIETAVITASLLYYATDRDHRGPSHARQFLLARNINLETLAFDEASIPSLIDVLDPDIDLASFVEEICNTRTVGEQVRSFLSAVKGEGPVELYPAFADDKFGAQALLALGDRSMCKRFVVVHDHPLGCPVCNNSFRPGEAQDLRAKGMTYHCGRYIFSTAS